jgi:ATP-dependent RNA helicase DHX57
MPGMMEIFQLIECIEAEGNRARTLDLIPLHSSLGDEDQAKAFLEPRPGMRKVIISTNIAESSITIPDIFYVIDFLLTKEIFYDPVTKNENLMTSWASKASA